MNAYLARMKESFPAKRMSLYAILGVGSLAVFSSFASATVFQAEDYNSFYDTTSGNTGGVYRADDVDIEATTDNGGGYNVAYIDTSEWLVYQGLNIPATGRYTINARVASVGGGTLSTDLNAGALVLATLNVPDTGGWQNWTTVSQTVEISAGSYDLGVFATTGNWNFNWIEVVAQTSGDSVATISQNCSFTGWNVGLEVGAYTLTDLQSRGFVNNDASSIQLTNGYEAVFYDNDDFTGQSITVSASDDCLVDQSFNDVASSVVIRAIDDGSDNSGEPGSVNATHKRLKIVNGCSDPMWVQWLTAPTVEFAGANRPRLEAGQSIEYDIPDKGLPSMRFWPGFGCDENGLNCEVGASGGPADLGFTCPPEGCAPPIDSKFEATFGCIPGVSEADCYHNPSAPDQPLGRGDWWNSSMVDGFTTPIKVQVNGSCPVAAEGGPGGPVGGVIDCSTLRLSDCPTNENLSTNGQFPELSNVNLEVVNPMTGAIAGCYSPTAKLTYNHWANGFQTYNPTDDQAVMYACPTPPISSDQCSSGPADSTQYRDMVHSHCETYAYAYDDGYGLSNCPAATDLSYEVTFYCPQ